MSQLGFAAQRSVPCCVSESAACSAARDHSFYSLYLVCCLLGPSLLALAGTVYVMPLAATSKYLVIVSSK